MAKKAAENGDPPPTLADTRTYSSSGTTAARARAPASTTPTSSPSATERSSVPLSAAFHRNPHLPTYGPAPPLPSYPTYPPPHRGQASYQNSPLNQPPQSISYGTYPPVPPAGYPGAHALGHGSTSSKLNVAGAGGIGPERNARRRGSTDHSALGGVGRRGSVPYAFPSEASSVADDFDADGPRLAHSSGSGGRLGPPYGRQQLGIAASHQARRGSVPLLQFGNLQLVSEAPGGAGAGGPRSAHQSPSNTGGRFGPSTSYRQSSPAFDAFHPGRRGSLPNHGGAFSEHPAYNGGQLAIPPYFGGQVDAGHSLPPQPLEPSALPAHYSNDLPEESFSYGDDPGPSPHGSDGFFADGSYSGGPADTSYNGLLADPFALAQEYYQQPEVVFELNSFELR
jgi:hypothetical protein